MVVAEKEGAETEAAMVEAVTEAGATAAEMAVVARVVEETEEAMVAVVTVVAEMGVVTVAATAAAAMEAAMEEPRSPRLRSIVPRASCQLRHKSTPHHCHPVPQHGMDQDLSDRTRPIPKPALRHGHSRSFGSPSARLACKDARHTGDTELQLHSTSPRASIRQYPRSSCRTRHT